MIETLLFIGAVLFAFYIFTKSSAEKRLEQQRKEDRDELVERMLDDYR